MKKYPSIEQFRNVIRTVKINHDYKGKNDEGESIYEHTSNYPILSFQGTVKIHGSNAAIVKYKDRIEYQSRERILSLNSDNSGFMTTMVTKDLKFLFNTINFNDYIAIYGEWCGGNIQKGVAINGLDKMFIIFGIKVDDIWIEIPNHLFDNDQNIYNILQFPTYNVNIDFNNPELIQNTLIDLTINIENSCPIGKFFNKEGIGEGLVFTCINNPDLKFKSKGEKHSVSKVKVLNNINVEELNSINEFIDTIVTENRLEQGISFFKENGIIVESKNTGEFLRWIVTDVLKEEQDTLIANKLDEKKVKNAIVTKARIWFLNHV